MEERRTVIIGLDGVPFGMLKELAEKGIMPNAGKLISSSIFRQMASSVPEISSVAWSSIITGVNPAEHGVFGFTDFPPNTYRLTFPNFDNLKAKPFWHKDNKKRHIIINVPSTYPARELNGVLISGFVALELEKAVYPHSILPVLKAMEYKIDVDSAKAHESLELFIRDLNRTNEARISAYRHLWNEDWDTFMFVFTGGDRLMHFLWDAYEDEDHDFHKEFKDYFGRVDEVIGEIASKIRNGDNLIMLSDHGFERLESDVYINSILRREGFLKLSPPDGRTGASAGSLSGGEDRKLANFSDIDDGTKAFGLDPARIYVNLRGKYPKGSVSREDRERIIKDLEALFENLAKDGRKVIKHIYRKEDIYKGPYFEQAPDLVLIGADGFNLKGSISSEHVYSKGPFTGKHTQHDAFLLVSGKCRDGIIPEYPSVFDVTDIIEKLRGGDK